MDEQRLMRQLQEINRSVATELPLRSDKLPTQQSLTVEEEGRLSHKPTNAYMALGQSKQTITDSYTGKAYELALSKSSKKGNMSSDLHVSFP